MKLVIYSSVQRQFSILDYLLGFLSVYSICREINGQHVFGTILHWLPDCTMAGTKRADAVVRYVRSLMSFHSPLLQLRDGCNDYQTDITNTATSPIPQRLSRPFVCTACITSP